MLLKGASHGLRFGCFIFSVEVGYYPHFDWWYIFPAGIFIVIALFIGDEAWRTNLSVLIQLERYVGVLKNVLNNYFSGLIVVLTGFCIGAGVRWYFS